MAEIVHFVPKDRLQPEQNITAFIALCRNELTVFGATLPFDDNVWDISRSIKMKGRSKAERAHFTSLAASQSGDTSEPLSEKFLPFAKAYFRYAHAMRPTKCYSNRLIALRVVDAALNEVLLNADVSLINHDVLDRAYQLVAENYAASTAPKVVGQIRALAEYLFDFGFTNMATKWTRKMKPPRTGNNRVGADADAARKEAMPSVAAIKGMAHVFLNAEEPGDVIVGSTLALLHCAPQRINETVRLKENCEDYSKASDGELYYGIRYPGSKQFPDTIRTIVPTMAEVAKSAISQLRAVSAPAREVALWYESNPTKIFLGPQVAYLRDKEWLTLDEISLVLFGRSLPENAESFCNREKISRKGGGALFAAIEASVIKKLPEGFPFAQDDVKYSESLFVVRRFELDAKLTMTVCLIEYVSSDMIASRIGCGGTVVETVFKKFNITEDDGTPVSLASHQARHYLNTLAQANQASQIDIALWSGRADIRQNAAYDHVSYDDLLSNVKELVAASDTGLFGGDLNTPKIRVTAKRDAEGMLQIGSAHITTHGMCLHDYGMSPCQIHMDCLNCNELVCVKGDLVKTENIRFTKNKTESLLRDAEENEQSGTYGASKWVVHHRQTLLHCDMLLKLLESPAIEDGALIQLTGLRPASRLEQAKAERNAKVKVIPIQEIKSVGMNKNV